MGWAIGVAQSSAVLLGPTVGATTAPGATAKLAINPGVPGRRSAYSGRAPRPGGLGQVGAARSSAWLPVFSSVLMTGPPGLAPAGACGYTSHTAVTWAAHATGAAGVALRPYSTRGGCPSA
jgi:hypothetical protein